MSEYGDLFAAAVSNVEGASILKPGDKPPRGKVAYMVKVNEELLGTVAVDDVVGVAEIVDHIKDNRPRSRGQFRIGFTRVY